MATPRSGWAAREFEEQIRPAVAETVEALRRALDAAGVSAADLDAVLMVGGSSRIPLITQMVSAELGRPVAVDADPKSVIATGAAIASRGGATVSTPAPTPQPRKAAGPDPSRAGPRGRAATLAAGPADGADPAPTGHGSGPPRPALTTTPRAAAALDGARVDAERRPEPRRTGKVIAGLGLAASLVSGVAILAFISGNDADAAPPRTATVLAAGPTTSPVRAPVTGTAPVDEWTGTAPTDTTLAGPRQPVYLAAAARPRVRTTPTGAAGASPAAPPASTSSSTTSPDAPPAPAGSSDDPGPGGNTPGGTGSGTELGEGDSGDTTGGNSDTEPGSGGGSGTGDPGAGNGDPGSGAGDPGGSADPDGSDPGGSDPGGSDRQRSGRQRSGRRYRVGPGRIGRRRRLGFRR